ncbi:MAG: serine/threonine protein kinase [bacterium]|nr:serine/threonine protein kinase [bacterium]
MNELPESPGGQDADAAIHHELLERLLEDEAGEGLRSVAAYQAMFRGHEALVERVVAELQGSSDATFEGRDRIGSYVLLEEIGRGGQGTVFLARDTRLPRLVALKLLSNAAGDLGGTRIERFRREAQAASKLDHPGICAVFETGEVDDIQFLAMRHVAGESLAMHIARAAAATDARSSILHLPRSETSSTRTTRRREFDATLHFIERVARALHVAHEAGIVHRDIKPGNIMVTPEGEPVVLDFGLARDLGDTAPGLTRTDEVFGTPAYMALEQLRPSGRGVDRRADIYALGVTLFECLTLQRPYALRNPVELADAIERGQAPDPRDRSPGLPTDLAVVVACAMASRPEARYQTALEFADDLRAVREFEAIQARPAGALLKSWRWMQRNPGVAISLALVILSLSTALVVSLVALDEAAFERSVAEDEARHRGDLNEFLRLVLESPNPHLMGPDTSIEAFARPFEQTPRE